MCIYIYTYMYIHIYTHTKIYVVKCDLMYSVYICRFLRNRPEHGSDTRMSRLCCSPPGDMHEYIHTYIYI